MTSDNNSGLHNKFTVFRNDGSSEPGQRHEHCSYFVLDLAHDKFAIPALKAYAAACEQEYPKLAADLLVQIRNLEGYISDEDC